MWEEKRKTIPHMHIARTAASLVRMKWSLSIWEEKFEGYSEMEEGNEEIEV